jgi:hypothetical protein
MEQVAATGLGCIGDSNSTMRIVPVSKLWKGAHTGSSVGEIQARKKADAARSMSLASRTKGRGQGHTLRLCDSSFAAWNLHERCMGLFIG